ncbi:MAG: hypothetical protein FJ128_01565 [Deltaproteobacteria bacterium]|nr:hypothetical protein [Deltaproteobacteria bacterium]
MARLILVVFGLMGTGKTTLALALGEALGWPVVHSDAVRKVLAGLGPTTPTPVAYGEGIYRDDFSARTYAEMRRRAVAWLAAAPGVILDASFKRAQERQEVRDLARQAGARACFIYCLCPLEVVRERLCLRQADASSISDGREELLAAQAQDFEPPTEADYPLLRLDTGRELGEVLKEAQTFLEGLVPASSPPGQRAEPPAE